ncbi:MAG TPA: DUF732 domain-containing protein [Chroococcales cyanobacterium]|jgi:hypothetical protein
MKRALLLSTFVLSLAGFLSTSALAQEESDYPCYLRQPDGTTVDLSAWCTKTPTTRALSPNAGFVSNFRTMTSQYPSNVQQELNRYSEENRDSAIAAAKTTCRVLRYGGTRAALTRQQALVSDYSSPSNTAKQQIIYSLAVNQYCPEFATR